MDDDAAGRTQADLVRQALEATGIDPGRLWVHYFSIGGEAGELEIEAFLHHSLTLPALQRDLLAHAVNELLDDRRPPRIPQASDLLDHDEQDGSEGGQHGGEGQDGADEP
ncbi:hypothetical protein RCG67_03065 [Kocuria sp. CPCC 205292]|uniref:hypothetical protein n=1 Tax=Kocuria cellulosilytica TaxID=3071451 RepID=UPI0034D65169